MQIAPILNLKISNRSIQNYKQPAYSVPYTAPLQYDTVSFGHVNKAATNTGKDLIEAQIKKNNERFIKQMANQYFAVSNTIAENLESSGISFNKKYALSGLLKSSEGTASKMSRTGSFSVPDRIRTTFFSKKFYDPSIVFEKIIPEYKDNGYVVSDIEMCIGLDKEKMPDFIKRTPEEYRQFINEKRKSGIEQYQIRFVREMDTRETPIKHELLVIPGYNYAIAKYYESTYIYDYIRNLGELNFIKRGSANDENVIKANGYIDIIKNTLNLEISQKLFSNAKNTDLYNISAEMPINVQGHEQSLLDSSFMELKKHLNRYYFKARERAKSQARIDELIKYRKEDLLLLDKIKLHIVGGKSKETGGKIQGAIEFFNEGGHKADPFK